MVSAYIKDNKERIERSLLLLLALLLPFDYLPTIVVGGLRMRLSIVVGIIAILWVATGVVRSKSWNISRLEALLLAWLGWMVLLLIVRGHDVRGGLKTLLPLLFLGLLSVAVSRLLKPQYIKPVIRALLVGAAITAVFGLYQFIANRYGLPQSLTGLRPEYSWERFGFPRLQSVALEPLYFSAFLLLPIGLLSVLLLKEPRYRSRIWVAALGLLILADFLTLSRGGLAALVIMLAVLSTLLWRKGQVSRYKKQIVLTGLSIVMLFALSLGVITAVAKKGIDPDLTYGQKGAGSYLSHLGDLNFFASKRNKEKNDSIAQRDTARSQALHILGSRPTVLLFGVGPGQYQSYVRANRDSVIYTTPNNLIIEQLVQTGLVGLGLFVALMVMLVSRLVRMARQHIELSFMAGALASYFIALLLQAQTFSGLNITHFWFAMGLAIFLVQFKPQATKHEHAKQKIQKKPKSRTRPSR